jgi:OmpA-OmpF porin, OOP family
MKASIVAVCGILICGTPLARADDSNSWYLVTQAGYLWTDSHRDAGSDVVYGLAVGHQFVPEVGLEFEALRSEHKLKGDGHLTLSSLMVNCVLSAVEDQPLIPFASLGAGVIRDHLPGVRSADAFAAQVGIGLHLQALKTDTFAFNVVPQIRMRWDSDGFLGSRGMYDWIATVGVQWVWSKAKTAPAQFSTAPSAPPPAVVTPPLDSDGDGVPDSRDQCPGTPPGVAVDEYGCPRRGAVTLRGVNFEFNSTTLTRDSHAELDAVAKDLQIHPRLKVELQGHTDSSGSASYNQALSQRRAEAVRDYLVSRGIPGAQMSAKGYGETQPIADNSTSAGRMENRRVVMAVLENPGNVEVKTESAPP